MKSETMFSADPVRPADSERVGWKNCATVLRNGTKAVLTVYGDEPTLTQLAAEAVATALNKVMR